MSAPLRPVREHDHPDVLAQQLPHSLDEPVESWQTKLVIAIILIGLLNFTAFSVIAIGLGGDAKNGGAHISPGADGRPVKHYYLRMLDEDTEVSRGLWIYSYIHAISIWITHAAVLLSLLALAKAHIIQRLEESAVKGQTVVTVIATLTIFIAAVMTAAFIIEFLKDLTA